MESLFVLVPVPHLGDEVDWQRDGAAFKQKVYGLLARRCGIEGDLVVYEKVMTPLDWRADYNLEEGAAFGIGHGIL
jgi:phytoene desaturase